jgi:hypothetical protein
MLLVFASGAHAAKKDPTLGKVKTKSAVGPAVSGNQAITTATATCPKDYRSIGGGFQATPGSGEILAVVYESQRASQRSWRASAQVNDGDAVGSASITTYVHCSKEAPKAKLVSATSPAPASTVGAFAAASCGGKVALGGGFSTPPPVQPTGVVTFALDSNPVGTSGWQTRVLTGPISSSTVTSYAYCAKKKQLPTIVARAGLPFTSTSLLEIMTATATCTGKRNPFAGGFSQSGASSSNASFVYESARSGKSWRASSLHAGGGLLSLTSHTLCG